MYLGFRKKTGEPLVVLLIHPFSVIDQSKDDKHADILGQQHNSRAASVRPISFQTPVPSLRCPLDASLFPSWDEWPTDTSHQYRAPIMWQSRHNCFHIAVSHHMHVQFRSKPGASFITRLLLYPQLRSKTGAFFGAAPRVRFGWMGGGPIFTTRIVPVWQ